MKTIYTTALLALGGFAATAQAQIQAGANDLILGFHATGGQGNTVSLEVDLGSVANFSGLAAGTSVPVSRLAVADLASTYGSNWATRSDLFWGIVGSSTRNGSGGPSGQPLATLWATAPESTIGQQSAPFVPGSFGAQAFASSSIEAVYASAPGSLTGATATTNSSQSAAIVTTLSGSFAAQEANQPGVSFSFFTPTIDNSTNLPGTGFAVSDLYELRPSATSATYLGSFGLSSTGLVFKSTATNYAAGAPAITTAPVATNVTPGGTLTLSVAASGSGLNYQWYDNGSAIAGATSATYTANNVAVGAAGNYSVAVSNTVSTVRSTPVAVAVTSVSTMPRLTNLSVITSMATTDTTTVGFVVGGTGTSGSEPVLIRGIGPSLSFIEPAGTALLDDPKISYFSGNTVGALASNDNWNGDATLTSIVAQVFAFPFASATSKDAALYIPAAASGNDSMVVTNGGTVSGVMLAEVYDATPTASYLATTPRLINVSINKNMGAGLTVGFTIGGTGSRTVLIRAIGPGLIPLNIPGITPATDPQLALFSQTQTVTPMQTNDNWGTPVGSSAATQTQISNAITATSAFPIPTNSKDAVILATLPAGGYTATVTPTTGSTTGQVIVEVYDATP